MTNIIILLSTSTLLFLEFWIITLLKIKNRNKLVNELLTINVTLSKENAELEYQNAQNKIQLEGFKKEAKSITDDLLELKNKVKSTSFKYSRLLSEDKMLDFLKSEKEALNLSGALISEYTGIGTSSISRIKNNQKINFTYEVVSKLFNFYKDVRQGKIVLDNNTVTKE